MSQSRTLWDTGVDGRPIRHCIMTGSYSDVSIAFSIAAIMTGSYMAGSYSARKFRCQEPSACLRSWCVPLGVIDKKNKQTSKTLKLILKINKQANHCTLIIHAHTHTHTHTHTHASRSQAWFFVRCFECGLQLPPAHPLSHPAVRSGMKFSA